jgi:hypothetical protein
LKRFLKILLFLFLGGVLSICILLHPSFNGSGKAVNYLHYLVWGNQLNVSSSNKLDQRKIKIEFENEIAILQIKNPEEAAYLIASDTRNKLIRKVIYKNGKQLCDIPYDYGKQRLNVYYDNVKIGSLGHWRTNGYHVHTYTINLVKKNGKISIKGSIKGPDEDFANFLTNENSSRL